MELLDTIKTRLGIFYSDAGKDEEVQGMLDGAAAYFKGAGWDISLPSPLAVEALVLYCKMAQSTDPAQLLHHPVLLSFIAQGRAEVKNAVL